MHAYELFGGWCDNYMLCCNYHYLPTYKYLANVGVVQKYLTEMLPKKLINMDL